MELTVTVPGQEPQRFKLSPGSIMLGSLTSNQIILAATGVDPIHALLEWRDNGWLLTDLGSSSGVLVNERKIEVEAKVKSGDKIQIGSAVLQLGEASSKSQAKPLFRQDQKSGETLEVIAYWQDTVLDVAHFHPHDKSSENVILGRNQKKSHFYDNVEHTLVSNDGGAYTLHLGPNMSGQVRHKGQLIDVGANSSQSLQERDLAHIRNGPISYFLLYTQMPELNLPKMPKSDPLSSYLRNFALIIFSFMVFGLSQVEPKHEKRNDDLWSIVHLPEIKPPKPKVKKKKPKVVEIAEVKAPPPPSKVPPKPKPKPVKPITKPKPPKPKKKKKPKLKMTENLTRAKTQPPKKVKQKSKKVARNSGSKAPAKSSGARKGKGKGKLNIKGVEGVKNKKASGLNLSKLGLGVGKVSNHGGAGAIATNFRSAAGGGGGGSGTAAKNFGMGGIGTGAKSLKLAGAGGQAETFGTGRLGLVGKSTKGSFSRHAGKANLNFKAGDPLISGGLTREEVRAVIKAHENELRHCYEQALQRKPSLSGRLTINFLIAVPGNVKRASIENSQIKDSSMHRCITARFKRWRFPKSRGGETSVRYPYNFSSL